MCLLLWKRRATTRIKSARKDCWANQHSKSSEISKGFRGKTLKCFALCWIASRGTWLNLLRSLSNKTVVFLNGGGGSKRSRKSPDWIWILFKELLSPFYEHPWSISGKIIFSLSVSNLGWATLPLNGIFNPEDGFVGCDRQGNHLPSGGRKRKKAEVALFRTASALLYFQSLNISSRA